jgi:predicted PurR-regulated permease PerM
MQEKEKLETRTFLLFLFIVSVGFILLMKPFFGTIFWACAMAVIFAPLQQRLLKRWPNRKNLSALATLAICIVIVILPLAFVISSVVSEGILAYNKLESGEINPAQYIESMRTAFPALNNLLGRLGVDMNNLKDDAMAAAMSSGKFIAGHTLSLGQNAFEFLMSMVLMLYVTFFMLRDGSYLVELLIRALPLGDVRERMLFSLFAEVTRATIKGNVVIAMLQGTIGGITLWALDIHGAILWGVVMAFASLIPAVGSALVWVPIALYLTAIGEVTSALILTGIGAGIIGMLDNVLRPILVGRDTKLPDYIVLLSTLGGIALFGINGFVIGPLVAALFLAFWGIFLHDINTLEPGVHTDPDPNENLPPEIILQSELPQSALAKKVPPKSED